MKKIQESEKNEIATLYRLGASIEEIEYILKAKFGKKLGQASLINFLFSII